MIPSAVAPDLAADVAARAACAGLELQRAAIVGVREQLEAAAERIPRSGGAARGGPAPPPSASPSGAPAWKGPARLAFEASLYGLERIVIDARDALTIAEHYTRVARDALEVSSRAG